MFGDTVFGIAERIVEAELVPGVRGFGGVEVIEKVLHRSVGTGVGQRVKSDL